jgi:hypothetical protein
MRNIFLFILFGWAGLLTTAHAQIIQSDIDLTDYQRILQITDSTSENNFSYTTAQRKFILAKSSQLSTKTIKASSISFFASSLSTTIQ